MKKNVNIGICGLGTVGAGTAQLIQKNAAIIQKRTGTEFQVRRAATIDPFEHLEIDFSNITISDSVDDILNDPDIDIVVELIGGDGLAEKIILEAFDQGKSVVTANKALLAKHSNEIFKAAYQSSGHFGFEASVGGGIPIIRSIRDGFSGDKIEGFSGIMNGTANYILTSMSDENAEFDNALKLAQEKGYAEADPTYDIEGIDTAHKVIILMELAFNSLFSFDQLYIEGITQIEPVDIQLADRLGYTIKLIGKAGNSEKGFEGRVHPALVLNSDLLASVKGAFNAISVTGNFVGHSLSYGAGAGAHPTASAVAADIIEIGRRLTGLGGERVSPLSVPFEQLKKSDLIAIDEVEFQFYLRFFLEKPEDEIARIEDELQQAGVDIFASEILDFRTESGNAAAVLTGPVIEKRMQELIGQLTKQSFLKHPIRMIRLAD